MQRGEADGKQLQQQIECSWIQGTTGLLQIMSKQSDSLKKTNKLQKKVDRIEQAIVAFFKDLADRIESIEGLDLTDRGDDVVGAGLCMLSASASSSCSESDSEFSCDQNDEEDEEDEEEEQHNSQEAAEEGSHVHNTESAKNKRKRKSEEE